jgi:hypothetical protein
LIRNHGGAVKDSKRTRARVGPNTTLLNG